MGQCTSKQPDSPTREDLCQPQMPDGFQIPEESGHQQEPLENGQEQQQQQQIKKTNIQDVIVSQAHFVQQNQGSITHDYMILSPPLGKGAYGEVRKAIHKASGQLRAIKIIKIDEVSKEDKQNLENEIDILRNLDHPNIIKIYEFYKDSNYFYIVSELCTGGELFDKIIEEKSFDEYKACNIIKQVLQAVNYCHSNKIVHRDLKPENLLYDNDTSSQTLKVIDFGTSRYYDPQNKLTQRLGTPYYIAPEVLKKEYNEKCDIWSCGVILYILLCGYPPFASKVDSEILEKVKLGTYDFNKPEWRYVSEDAKKLINNMLQYNPQQRYSARQCLQDKWFTRYSNEPEVKLSDLQQCLFNMKTFRSSQKLQEAAYMFLVNYVSTKEEKDQLLKTFKQLDTDGDGMLSQEELLNGYKKIMSAVQAEEEVKKIMNQVDKNKSGKIDYSEFVMATCNRQNMLSKEKLQMAFKMFDKDNNGSLTVDEIRKLFNSHIQDDEVIKDIIKEVDKNQDGQISFAEFRDMMLSLTGN
ncbi:hypothetical protein ABPG73_019079 [Tetrahymena malaccensis]